MAFLAPSTKASASQSWVVAADPETVAHLSGRQRASLPAWGSLASTMEPACHQRSDKPVQD